MRDGASAPLGATSPAAHDRDRLQVFITVDTELWPFASGWPVAALPAEKSDFSGEIAGYFQGRTKLGAFGVPYQLDVLRRYGLKATYFVEALFADKVGAVALRDIVQTVQAGGQEVQLHIHSEWLRELRDAMLPPVFKQHIRQFGEDEQTALIARGIENLRAAGVREVCAFRAGNYGADRVTLRALARCGIRFDTSYNACYLHSACGIATERPLLQPSRLEGIVELPVSCFTDYPGHLRPAQLCACSFAEMRAMLLRAREAGWRTFVIVLHGFELVRHVREPSRRRPDRINIDRFERLCAFLAENPARFQTMHFADIDLERLGLDGSPHALRSRLSRTGWRVVEQLASRLQ